MYSKKFLTFSIPYDVGNSFYVLPTDRHQMAFMLRFAASVCVCMCVSCFISSLHFMCFMRTMLLC